MEGRENGAITSEKIHKEVPQLTVVLKEMKEGLDMVTSKVQALTAKVKEKQFPTAEGISYLEAKHLLLISYCQSLVYYLLRKAKGLSIEEHPVVRSLVEIRLFLEKIRPIDKKCGYRIDRLLAAAKSDGVRVDETEKVANAAPKSEDFSEYRPNPDMLVSKTDTGTGNQQKNDLYKVIKMRPTTMEEDRKKAKEERNAERMLEHTSRKAKNSDFVRGIVADIEGRPEEVREVVAAESKDLSIFMDQMEKRRQQEEETFNRAPITKADKKRMKQLSRANGLLGLTDDFYDEISALPLGDDADGAKAGRFGGSSSMERKHKKRKMRR